MRSRKKWPLTAISLLCAGLLSVTTGCSQTGTASTEATTAQEQAAAISETEATQEQTTTASEEDTGFGKGGPCLFGGCA